MTDGCKSVTLVVTSVPESVTLVVTSLSTWKRDTSSDFSTWKRDTDHCARNKNKTVTAPLGQERVACWWHLIRAVFGLSVESLPGLLRFCFSTLCDWSRNLAPPSQPIRCKTKTNLDLVTRVSPRSRPVTCIYFAFSLPGSLWYLSLFWLALVITLVVVLRHCHAIESALDLKKVSHIKSDTDSNVMTLIMMVCTVRWAVALLCCEVCQWRDRGGRQAAMRSRPRWVLLWEMCFCLQPSWPMLVRNNSRIALQLLRRFIWLVTQCVRDCVTYWKQCHYFSQNLVSRRWYFARHCDVVKEWCIYLFSGYFDQQLRQNLFTSWASHLQQANIQFRPDIARVEVRHYRWNNTVEIWTTWSLVPRNWNLNRKP